MYAPTAAVPGPGQPSVSVQLYANLAPAVADMDFGEPTGAAFPDRAPDELFEVQVQGRGARGEKPGRRREASDECGVART